MEGKRSLESRGDGSELLFVQGGLDGGPGIPDGCWCLMNFCAW